MNNQTKTKGKTYAIINLIFYSFFLIFLITYLVLEIKYKPAKSLLKILEEYKKPGDYEFLKPFTNIQNWYFAFSKFLLHFINYNDCYYKNWKLKNFIYIYHSRNYYA